MSKRKVVWWFLLIAYCGFIVWMTLLNRGTVEREFSMEIFWSVKRLFTDKVTGPTVFKQYVMNILFFIPFGFLVMRVIEIRVLLVTAIAAIVSSSIEITQYLTARGFCEIDDVISNTAGAMLGCVGFILWENMKKEKRFMYAVFFKRILDFFLSLCALIVLSPLLLMLIVLGTVFMRGNPFFTQERPGKDEKVFKLIKFRSMDNRKDKNGKVLPDEVRLNKYGRFLRGTSLDELPEIVNILKGDMSIIGPRPLLVRYLPYYTKEERIRHLVRPGLTGYAQAHGRNAVTWDEKLAMDVWYVNHLTFLTDVKVFLDTIIVVLKRESVEVEGVEALDVYRIRKENEK